MGELDLDFDVQEWHLQLDEGSLGPVDLATIRAMASDGRACGSTLVRSGTSSQWARLDELLPDLAGVDLGPARADTDDVVVFSLEASKRAQLILLAAWWTCIGAVTLAWFHSISPFFTGAVLGYAVRVWRSEPDRIEVTKRVVRLVITGRIRTSIPLVELRCAEKRWGRFAPFAGGQRVRSRSGARITVGFEYGLDGFRDLVSQLGLDSSACPAPRG